MSRGGRSALLIWIETTEAAKGWQHQLVETCSTGRTKPHCGSYAFQKMLAFCIVGQYCIPNTISLLKHLLCSVSITCILRFQNNKFFSSQFHKRFILTIGLKISSEFFSSLKWKPPFSLTDDNTVFSSYLNCQRHCSSSWGHCSVKQGLFEHKQWEYGDWIWWPRQLPSEE